LNKLQEEPTIREALSRRSFIESGLGLVTNAECPLCDASWETTEGLREHLSTKLRKLKAFGKVEAALLDDGRKLAEDANRVVGMIVRINKIASQQSNEVLGALLSAWKSDLDAVVRKLATFDGISELKARLTSSWLLEPSALLPQIGALKAEVEKLPDQSATLDAQTFLSTAQVRLGDYREAMRRRDAAGGAFKASQFAYDTYCGVLEDELNTLYDEVQQDFSAFYREINGTDESSFTAKLTPTEGSLALDVNFYERGLFPPGAFHSEGHQDGMGVCLYLALMKRLFGKQFTLALLDDVVMSVDADHRYQFCKLLKNHFPDTQFVITTHDRLWAEQMKSAGLVVSKTSVAFHSWTIDTGPLVESNIEIWDELASALSKGKVDAAAAALRHHLEYVSRFLADQLGATPQFRADGNYELGDLMPSVLKRFKDLLGKAADAAQSWGDAEKKDDLASRKADLASSNGATSVEQWAVNKAVHYNEWANFGKADFAPVVTAYRSLLERFRCAACESWLYASPRVAPESLRCMCGTTNLNLRHKPK
jgi:hypothetical protein